MTEELIEKARLRAMIGADVDPIDAAQLLNELADALEIATRVPVQGEPNDDREALATLVQRFEESDNPDYLLADFLLSQGVGFSRATVPDAATERVDRLNREFAEIDAIDLKAERDAALAAVERVRDAIELHNPNGRLVKEVLAALEGAPEPEYEAVEEMYQAGCGSWDCRAPECGRA